MSESAHLPTHDRRGTHQVEVRPGSDARPQPPPSFEPTPQDWKDYRQIITRLYRDESMKYATIAEHMRERYGFHATPRMYYERLHNNWGCRRYLNAKARGELCHRLTDDHSHGRDTSYVTLKDVRNLLRHVKKNVSQPNEELLNTLRTIERELLSSNKDSSSEQQPASTTNARPQTATADDQILEQLFDQDDLQHLSSVDIDFDGNMSETWELSEPDFFPSADAPSDQGVSYGLTLWDDVNEHSLIQAGGAVKGLVPSSQSAHPPPSIVNQLDLLANPVSDPVNWPVPPPFGGSALGLDHLQQMVQAYFSTRLRLCTAPSRDFTNPSSTWLVHSPSKTFWTTLKSAIYFLKSSDDAHAQAWPMLQEAIFQVNSICKTQSVSLLRELLTTLSKVNTSIYSSLRGDLLRLFAQSAYEPGVIDPNLCRICLVLQEEWVTDETLTTVLCTLLRVAEDHPNLLGDEIFELHRARIRLLRQRGDLQAAEHLASSARKSVEAVYGADSVQTRLIMSEQIYILNRQGRYNDALDLSLDVVRRAERFDEEDFPSQRSVYNLEDLAEVYGNLGRRTDARRCLRRAFGGALRNWDCKQSTLHVHAKLEKLELEVRVKAEGD